MTYSDSHCHLDRYQPEEKLTSILEQARAKGVELFVSVGKTVKASEGVIRIAQSHEGVLATIGIHPWEAVPLTDDIRKNLYNLARKDEVKAIGEVGLDYVRFPQTKDIQRELFKYQLSLAKETGLPLNIHCKDAHQDMMQILRQETGFGIRGLIHGFSGDSATLKDWLALGFYVSIGMRGFIINEVPSLQTVVREIPAERLLIETDATGTEEISSPVEVITVAEKLASLRETTAEDIGNTATVNLRRLLQL